MGILYRIDTQRGNFSSAESTCEEINTGKLDSHHLNKSTVAVGLYTEGRRL